MPEFHKFSPRRLFVLLPVLAFVAVSGYGAAAAAQDSSAGAGLYGILGHGAPKVTSADGRFSIKPAGRLLVDFASVEDDEGFEDTNDAAFRAARVGIEGVAWRDFAYKVEVDFSGDDTQLTGAKVEYSGLEGISIEFGQIKPPASIEALTSSRFITLMERGGFTSAFGPQRRLGAIIGKYGTDWSLYAGILGPDPNSPSAFNNHVFAARAIYGPAITKDISVHIGASVLHRKNAGSDNTIRYSHGPHSRQARNKFIDTGEFAASSDTFYGLEAAAMLGPVMIHGEYAWVTANRVADEAGVIGPDPTFEGGYVSASWFVTGEPKSFNRRKGSFDRPAVFRPLTEGGWGALEVAVRLDFVDLSDNDIGGGEQTIGILGVNWYPTPYIRLTANYAHASIKGGMLGDANGDNEVDALMFRAQIDW